MGKNLHKSLNTAVFVMLQTKGGCAKSTTANQVLAPYLFERTGKAAKFFEIDHNNFTGMKYKNTVTKEGLYEIMVDASKSGAVERLEDVYFNEVASLSRDYPLIIDVGVAFTEIGIEVFAGNSHPDVYFIIPILRSDADAQNAFNTIKLIQDASPDKKKLKIIVAFCATKWRPNTKDEIRLDHMETFGNEDFKFKNRFAEAGIKETYFCVEDFERLNAISKSYDNCTIFDMRLDKTQNEAAACAVAIEAEYQKETDKTKKDFLDKEHKRLFRKVGWLNKADKHWNNSMFQTFEQIDECISRQP